MLRRCILGLLLAALMLLRPPVAAALSSETTPVAPAAMAHSAGPRVEVVEHLRLRVPHEARQAWLIAEQASWEPWLRRQPGFLGRDLYWDADRQEGVLLIRWASQQAWDSIPQAEIDQVQAAFEACARRALGRSEGNPFPLLSSGSLLPIGQP